MAIKRNTGARVTELQQQLTQLQQQNQSLSAEAADLRTKSIDFTGDLTKGKEFGQEVLGPSGLGRLGNDAQIQDVLSRYKNIADQGLSRGEIAAERAQAFRGIESGTQTGLRSLQAQLARSGVKGAVAGQQLINREMAGAQQKADVEQNLFLKSEQMKREGLGEYSQRLGDIKQFDLGQVAAEKDIMMQSQLGIAQIGSAERTAKYSAERAKEASIAAARAGRPACFLVNTKIEMNDGTFKNIQDIKPSDTLKNNNIVDIVGQGLSDDFYEWRGIYLTGEHCVYEQGWCKVKNAKSSIKVELPLQTVYNIFTRDGVLYVKDNKLGDYSSLWTLGGINAIISNLYKSVFKRGLQFVTGLVDKMGMGSPLQRIVARNRINSNRRK